MSAVISPCGLYRYRLERRIDIGPSVLVIMLNPSTADAEKNDPTIGKLIGFGTRLGWGRIMVGNLFGLRSTNPKALQTASDPIGPDNDYHLRQMLRESHQVVLAWGAKHKLPATLREAWAPAIIDMVQAFDRTPMRFGELTQCGQPRHPLMLAYATPLLPWAPASC
jgi:hypothetical protein